MTKASPGRWFHFVGLAPWLGLALAVASCARSEVRRCDVGPGAAAADNAASLNSLAWSPFGRSERGWAIYAPLIAHELGAPCPATSPGFAMALSQWQAAHGLKSSGVMDIASFGLMKRVWQERRPFVAASRLECPASPAETSLSRARVTESYGGKAIWLRPRALAAYRAMAAAARAQSPQIAADPRLLTIFSAYRSAAYDDARCAKD